MTPRDAAKAAAVARSLRREILAGTYDEDGKLPSRTELAKQFRVSPESASAAVRLLAAEGWASVEHGRGAFLRPRRLFEVRVEVPRSAGDVLHNELALAQSVEVGARDEPALETVHAVQVDQRAARVRVSVAATSAAMAGEIAERLVWSAPGWSWDGWDLAGSSVTAAPA